MEQYTALKTIF